MLKPLIQQASKKGLKVEGLIRMDVLPIVGTLKEVATSALGRGDGVGKEEIPEGLVPKRDAAQPDKDILGFRIGSASATTSLAELWLVERLLEHRMSRLVPSGHVFGPPLSSFSHQFHAHSSCSARKQQKHHIKISPWY